MRHEIESWMPKQVNGLLASYRLHWRRAKIDRLAFDKPTTFGKVLQHAAAAYEFEIGSGAVIYRPVNGALTMEHIPRRIAE